MENLPIEFNQIIIFLGLASVVGLVIYNFRLNKRSDPAQPDQQKSYELIHDAIKKSQAILGSAELEGIKVAAETKFETAKLEEAYQSKLEEVLNQSQQKINQAQNQLLQFMAGLQARSSDFEGASQKAIQDRINQLFEQLEERMGEFLISAEGKTTSSLELELKSTRQLIETYKQQQLKLIDENILAMMEQTLNLVLGKKLSLKDQLDLIYEALEKAKAEKFVV